MNVTYLMRTRSRLAVLRISHQESLSLGLLVARAATFCPLLLPQRYEAGRCRKRAGRDVEGVKGGGGSWGVHRDRQRRASHIDL